MRAVQRPVEFALSGFPATVSGVSENRQWHPWFFDHEPVRCILEDASQTQACSNAEIRGRELGHWKRGTLNFRRAFLFSLHHKSASEQLCLLRASSIRRMSMNKSISTSAWQHRTNSARNSTNKVGTRLDALLLGNMPGSLHSAVPEDPVYHPPVQASVDPSRIFRVFTILDILDYREMFASLTRDIQGR
jgi:hypothetical protein